MSAAAVPELILEARAALEEHGEAIAPLFTMPGELDAHRRALGRSDADLADPVVLAIAKRSAEHVLDAVRRARRAREDASIDASSRPVLVRRFPIAYGFTGQVVGPAGSRCAQSNDSRRTRGGGPEAA